jgi:DNA-directed RNA polymerase subunit RPC12/RpoP
MSNDYTVEDYYETVESIAKEALSEPSRDRDQFIHESVDGNSYIIMYAGPPVVKEASDNWPASDMEWSEVHSLAGDSCDDDQFLQVAAYTAMEADIYQAIKAIEEDWEECVKCGHWFDPDNMDEGAECEECKGWFCDGCLHPHPIEEDIYVCKSCLEDFEDSQPDHGADAFYTPSGPLGSRTSASFGTEHLGVFDSDEAALDAIRRRGKMDSYFPSVWFIDDHGGYRLEEDFSYDD